MVPRKTNFDPGAWKRLSSRFVSAKIFVPVGKGLEPDATVGMHNQDLRIATQAWEQGAAPPTLAIVSNRPDEVPESYQRYLAHGFREAWPFTGSPPQLEFTRRGARR